MRKLIMWNLATLDGFFEGGKKWEIDWHEYVWGPELEQLSLEQSKEIGVLVFGRVTYEGMAGYWSKATGEVADFMNSVPKIVCSHTLAKAGWKNTRLVSGNAVEEIEKLKKEQGKDLYVFGSADLSSTLTEHGLFDEYRVCLTPLLLGGGTPLFKPNPKRIELKLIEARPLKSGCVILRYTPDIGQP